MIILPNSHTKSRTYDTYILDKRLLLSPVLLQHLQGLLLHYLYQHLSVIFYQSLEAMSELPVYVSLPLGVPIYPGILSLICTVNA